MNGLKIMRQTTINQFFKPQKPKKEEKPIQIIDLTQENQKDQLIRIEGKLDQLLALSHNYKVGVEVTEEITIKKRKTRTIPLVRPEQTETVNRIKEQGSQHAKALQKVLKKFKID